MKRQLCRQAEIAQEEEQHRKREEISRAMALDKKWQLQEASDQDIRTKNLVDFALLKNFPEYSATNPAPADREHPLSWRLSMFASPPHNRADPSAGKSLTDQSINNYSLVGSGTFHKDSGKLAPVASKGGKQKPYTGGESLPVHVLASSNVSISCSVELEEY